MYLTKPPLTDIHHITYNNIYTVNANQVRLMLNQHHVIAINPSFRRCSCLNPTVVAEPFMTLH